MKRIFTVLFFSSMICLAISQDEWTIIHPTPTLNNLIDAHFITEQEGWVVGTEGTILYTSDGGQNWEFQHSDPDESFWSIFFIDEEEGWVCGWSKIYHTENAGQSWNEQDHPNCLGDLTDIFFINRDTGWVVGRYKIVLKTTDGGKNWTKIMNNIYQDGGFKRVDFRDYLHGCAVGDNLGSYPHEGFVMITSDGGLTWTETTPDNSDWLTAVEFYNDTCVWACGYNKVYRSSDRGLTWSEELSDFDWYRDIHFFNQDEGLLLDNHMLRLTYDGGDNWDSVIYLPDYNESYQAFTSWEEGKGVVVGFDGVIRQSLDEFQAWTPLHNGLRALFGSIGFFDQFNGIGISYISWGDPGLIRTLDGGYTWEYDTIIENGPFYDMHMNDQQCYLLCSDSMLIMKTLDAGQNWEALAIPSPTTYYSDIFFVNENTGFLCGPQGFFIKTENGGIGWSNLTLGGNPDLRNMYFVDEDNGWMLDYDGKFILHTSNGGDSWAWRQLGTSITYQPEDVYFLDANNGFVCTDDGTIFKSTDGGETWTPHTGLGTGSYPEFLFTSETEGWLLSGRIYHTLDGGDTWDDGLYFGNCARSLYFLDEEQGWIGGCDGLVVRYDGTVGLTDDPEQIPALEIFPNPARDLLHLSVEQQTWSQPLFIIRSLSGQEIVRTTIHLNDGQGTIDISSLASGTYLLQVDGNQNRLTTKFIKY